MHDDSFTNNAINSNHSLKTLMATDAADDDSGFLGNGGDDAGANDDDYFVVPTLTINNERICFWYRPPNV